MDGVAQPALSARDRGQGSSAPPPPPPPPAAIVAPGKELVTMIRRQWKLIALFPLVAAAIGWVLAATQPPVYRASAMASIAPLAEGLEANEFLRGVEVLERRTVVVTIAALASTPATRTQVAADPGYTIEAAILPNTNLVRVDVDGRDGARAAAIANRVPAVLNTQSRTMFKYYGVTMVSPATRPAEAYLPRPGRAVAAGLLIGLFLGLLAAWLADSRFRSRAV